MDIQNDLYSKKGIIISPLAKAVVELNKTKRITNKNFIIKSLIGFPEFT